VHGRAVSLGRDEGKRRPILDIGVSGGEHQQHGGLAAQTSTQDAGLVLRAISHAPANAATPPTGPREPAVDGYFRVLRGSPERRSKEASMQPRNDATYSDADKEVVASYATYAEAQRAVDALSDAGFPVESVDIVGHDVRLVERVTGRLTNARAAGIGAASGAWFGLFIGLLVGLFTTGPEWIGLMFGGLLIGAIWGAVFGFVAHWLTRGQRDFSSVSSLVAGRYDVTAARSEADRAREILGSLL